MWVVRRTHQELLELPPDPGPAPRPDRSIVVAAMAEYVRFTGKQIGMPTIRGGERDYLRDGDRLLEALRLAGHIGDVFCLWLGEPRANSSSLEPFDSEWEARTGSSARLITFHTPLAAAQRDRLIAPWRVPPQQITELSWGWTEEEAASLPDWLAWLRAVAEIVDHLPPVASVNGRRAVFPPKPSPQRS